ncbi:MAG: hypothetical protein GX881_02940, partial [Firmicutes bacterium]|nr:hypothetical protein [Bacillota bacterium]
STIEPLWSTSRTMSQRSQWRRVRLTNTGLSRNSLRRCGRCLFVGTHVYFARI